MTGARGGTPRLGLDGAARAVVLVHGLGSSYEHGWRRSGWPDALAAEGRRAVPFELPGHGSGAPLPPDGDDVTVLLAALGVPAGGRVDAVGFSAGGSLLLRAAVRQPAAFGRLAVLGVGDGVMRSTDGPRSRLADALEGPEPAEPFVRALWRLAGQPRNSRPSIAAYLRRPVPPVTAAELGRVTAPVLVVLGDRDAAGPADRLVAALPRGRLVTLPGADHFALPTDVRCLDAVTRFLAEPGAG